MDSCNDTWGVLFGDVGTCTESWGKLTNDGRECPRPDISEVLPGAGDVDGTDALREPGIRGWMDSCTNPRGVLLGVGGLATDTRRLSVSEMESGATPSEMLEPVSEMGARLVRS